MRPPHEARVHRARCPLPAVVLAALIVGGCAGGLPHVEAKRSNRSLGDPPARSVLGSEARLSDATYYLRDLHADGAGRVRALLSPMGANASSRVATLREDGSFTAVDVPIAYGAFPRGAREATRVLGLPRGGAGGWQIFTPDAAGRWAGEPLPAGLGYAIAAVEDPEGHVLSWLTPGAPVASQRPENQPLLLATRDAAGAASSRALSSSMQGEAATLMPGGPHGLAAAFWEDRAPAGQGARERALVYVGPEGARREVYVTREALRPSQDRVGLLTPSRGNDAAVIAFTVAGAVYVAQVHARGGVDVARAFSPVSVGTDLCTSRPEALDRAACEAEPPCRLDTREVRGDIALARTSDGAAWLIELTLVAGADLHYRWIEEAPHPWDPAGRGSRPPRFNHCRPEGDHPLRAELEVLRVGAGLDLRVRREVEVETTTSPPARGLCATAHGQWVYWGYTGTLGARVERIDTSRL